MKLELGRSKLFHNPVFDNDSAKNRNLGLKKEMDENYRSEVENSSITTYKSRI